MTSVNYTMEACLRYARESLEDINLLLSGDNLRMTMNASLLSRLEADAERIGRQIYLLERKQRVITSIHREAQGMGDQGAFNVWNAVVTELIGPEQTQHA